MIPAYRSILFYLILLVHFSPIFAQEIFRPGQPHRQDILKQINRVNLRLEKDIKNLPSSLPNRKKMVAEYEERAAELIKQLESEAFLTDSLWTNWFDGVLNEIYRGNPTLPQSEITLLIGRYESANAVNIGDGTIVFNLGLLRFMENESQVAFILCHEIAHYINHHSNNFIQEYIQALYAPETQKQLKNIAKSKYDRSARAMELMKGMMYNNRRHGRYKELEADSVALALFRNTRYQLQAGPQTMRILDAIDSSTWPVIPYKMIFDHPQFPFQNSWIAAPPKSAFIPVENDTSGDWNTDSLKTHPDCQKRLVALERQMASLPVQDGGQAAVQSEVSFARLKQHSDFEVIQSLLDAEAYGRCMFRALVLLQQYPDDINLNATIGQCLYYIHLNQKKHTLRYVLELPDPKYSDEYNRYLRFLNQFRISDLGKMGYYFCQKQVEKYPEQEYIRFSAVLSTLMINLPEEFKTRRAAFIQKFPNSTFITILNTID